MKILLIEDEINLTNSLASLLSGPSITIDKIILGMQGIDLGKLSDYAVIILDITLPDIYGSDVLKKFQLAKISTPVLIISIINTMEEKALQLGYGPNNYLSKPCTKDAILQKIDHLIASR